MSNPLDSKKKRVRVDHWNSRRVTTFYPQYGENRDKIQPVRGVFPTMFQEVIPRYDLSASDTRDDGVGPMFEETPYAYPMVRKQTAPSRALAPKPAKKKQKRKIRIDFSV